MTDDKSIGGGGTTRERHPREQGEDAAVERLIRLADPGPKIPRGEIERVKERLRPVWQHQVRIRRFRRRVAVTLGAVAAAAAVFVVVRLAVPPESTTMPGPAARVSLVRGAVEVLPEATTVPLPATVDTEIADRSVIQTAEDGRLALDLADGRSLRVDASTRVAFDGRTIRLARGAVYLDSNSVAGSGWEVATRFGSIREVGTQFEVRVRPEGLHVRVREGSVNVSDDSAGVEVDGGSGLKVAPDGARRIETISTHGPEWEWVQLIAPPIAIEGLSVASFMRWVGRETGLVIEYSDPLVRDLATTTILHGSIEGLSPLDSLSVVLPSAGLGAERVEAALIVHRIGAVG